MPQGNIESTNPILSEKEEQKPMITYSLEQLASINPEQILKETEHTNSVFGLELRDLRESNELVFDFLHCLEGKDNLCLVHLNDRFLGYRFHSKGIYNNVYQNIITGRIQMTAGTVHGFKIEKINNN